VTDENRGQLWLANSPVTISGVAHEPLYQLDAPNVVLLFQNPDQYPEERHLTANVTGVINQVSCMAFCPRQIGEGMAGNGTKKGESMCMCHGASMDQQHNMHEHI
jgi:hypothetical protein